MVAAGFVVDVTPAAQAKPMPLIMHSPATKPPTANIRFMPFPLIVSIVTDV
jgi:hypothetical protein